MNMTDYSPPVARFTVAVPQLFDGTAMRGPAWVTCSDGLIEDVGFGEAPGRATAPPRDTIPAPGFGAIQVNGGAGVLLNDERTETGVRRIVEAHRRSGATG